MNLIELLYDTPPWQGFDFKRYDEDLQGWNSAHPYLEELVRDPDVSLIIELGVWKGASVINMAELARDLQKPLKIIAVDTWLGSPEHWDRSRHTYHDLDFRYGYPQLYYQFLANTMWRGVSDYVIPLPQTTDNAFRILRGHDIEVDAVHIDTTSSFDSVLRDLNNYDRLLRPGGFLVGDNYPRAGTGAAALAFAEQKGYDLQIVWPKFMMRKQS